MLVMVMPLFCSAQERRSVPLDKATVETVLEFALTKYYPSWFNLREYIPKTIISREYSSEWKPGDEPYYPVNDEANSALYGKYKELADKEENVVFGGRLGEYKYYDMDAVVASALEMCEKELG